MSIFGRSQPGTQSPQASWSVSGRWESSGVMEFLSQRSCGYWFLVLFQGAANPLTFYLLNPFTPRDSYGDIRGFYLLSLWMKPYGVSIQMEPRQQYFLMVLFMFEWFKN